MKTKTKKKINEVEETDEQEEYRKVRKMKRKMIEENNADEEKKN